jgi:hypothetical protein
MPEDMPPPRSPIDWSRIATDLAPVEVLDDPVTVKKRSRDFFWYSPILNAELRRSFGDLVARPKRGRNWPIALPPAHAHDVPVTIRGGGTGNYGQAVPLQGGLIVETTAMNRILEIGEGFVRVEAGALMADINAALIPEGWEMAMFPSTQDIATIGGFVAGGSAGHRVGRQRALAREGQHHAAQGAVDGGRTRRACLRRRGRLRIHHAWGLNGAITEVTLRTVPTRDWVGCMAGSTATATPMRRAMRWPPPPMRPSRASCARWWTRASPITSPGWKIMCRRGAPACDTCPARTARCVSARW